MGDLITSLVNYVKDIKPYHTKIYGVDVEYQAYDTINVNVNETFTIQCFLGLPLGDLSLHRWGVDGYLNDPHVEEYIRGLNYLYDQGDIPVQPWDSTAWDQGEYDQGEIVNPQFVDLSRDYDLGWDMTPWDARPFDESLVAHVPIFIKPSLRDLVYVNITESINFTINFVTSDVDDMYTYVHSNWDYVIDGIRVVRYTEQTVYIEGDVTNQMATIPSFTISESSLNNGTYVPTSYTYDPHTNTTEVTIDTAFNELGYGGIIQVGIWDSDQWDGNNSTITSHPDTDVYASTTFLECISIVDGYSWDDGYDGGWDARPFDDSITMVNECSMEFPEGWDNTVNSWDAFPWDNDDYLPGYPWDGNHIATYPYDPIHPRFADDIDRRQVGHVVFSAEDIHAPVEYIDPHDVD